MKNLLLIAMAFVAFNVNAQNVTVKAIVESPLCHGAATGSIDLLIDGGQSPFTYLWSNGETTPSISSLIADTYVVTVTDNNGLVTTSSIKISEPDQLTATGFVLNCSQPGSSDGGINLTIRGGTHDYFFAWDNGATSQNISGLVAADYTVVVTDGFGCQVSLTKRVDEPTPMHISGNYNSLSDNNSTNSNNNGGMLAPNGTAGAGNMNISMYPNPTSNFLSIKSLGAAEVTVINSNGQVVAAQKTNTENTKVDVSNLPNGNYVVQVKTATETVNKNIAIVK